MGMIGHNLQVLCHNLLVLCHNLQVLCHNLLVLCHNLPVLSMGHENNLFDTCHLDCLIDQDKRVKYYQSRYREEQNQEQHFLSNPYSIAGQIVYH